MGLREAVESDAKRIAGLTDAPRDVMRNLIHDRTVRVVDDEGEICGFVSYDARKGTVYITQLEGEPDSYDELMAEPIRFAQSEGMAVELLVERDRPEVAAAAEAAGFVSTGDGPRFDGEVTIRYRIENP